jgi:DNA mismatch repair protein MutS
MRSPDENGFAAASTFRSILFDGEHDGLLLKSTVAEPDFFADLHLDQVVASLVEGRQDYDLAPFFYTALHDVEAVHYRHHILGDLERPQVAKTVREFAGAMQRMRKHLELAGKVHHARQKQRWFVEAVAAYCRAVQTLREQLAEHDVRSHGFSGLLAYLNRYVAAEGFSRLVHETANVRKELATVRYAIHIRGNRVRVTSYEGEPDMSEEIEQTFERFRQGAVSDHLVKLSDYADMNHVEGRILDLVAELHPDTFAELDQYCSRNDSYLDQTISRFDREVQFYLAYLEYIEPLKRSGLRLSYPRVSGQSKEVHAGQSFDLALARKLLSAGGSIVCNDFQLTDQERILVVSGPNNGGKTTFARTFGQLHYLASLGLPVPGVDVRLFLPDRIFTHFEREEDIQTLRGKFEDELFRIHEILERASAASVLIMNESFGSTTLRDALVVGTEVLRLIIDLDALCVFVTFVDELSTLGPSTVSMMSTVVAEDPAVRTYKVVRKPADGLAYAAAIAAKYGLSHAALRRRLAG